MGFESQKSFRPHHRNERAKDEEKERADGAFHNENLFDEGQDKYGNIIDPATGKLINEAAPTSGVDEDLSVIEIPKEVTSEDVLGALPEEDDEAARWLRKHDKDDDFKKAA